MVDVPVLLAFTGGLVATVNPCGFAMLPAYLSFFLGIEDATQRVDRAAAVSRALWVGVVVSAGFVTVFGVAGLVLSTGARVLTSALPWAALMVGAAVIGVGGWLLTGRGLRTMVPAPGRAVQGRSPGAVFMFGVAYAVASLSCTLPVFLAVVAGTATNLGAMSTLIVFGVYAAGMTLPLLALTVGLAFGRDALCGAPERSAVTPTASPVGCWSSRASTWLRSGWQSSQARTPDRCRRCSWPSSAAPPG